MGRELNFAPPLLASRDLGCSGGRREREGLSLARQGSETGGSHTDLADGVEAGAGAGAQEQEERIRLAVPS